MEIFFCFAAAGLVLLQIYLSLRKRWLVGMVLPGMALLAPFVLRLVESVRFSEARLFTFSVLTAVVMLGIHFFCRIFLDMANKDAEKFAVTEVTEDLQ